MHVNMRVKEHATAHGHGCVAEHVHERAHAHSTHKCTCECACPNMCTTACMRTCPGMRVHAAARELMWTQARACGPRHVHVHMHAWLHMPVNVDVREHVQAVCMFT